MRKCVENISRITIKVNCKSVYIGDPCYMISDELYDKIVCGDKWDNCILGDNDNDFGLVHSTECGDGYFSGIEGDYGVDAGCLSIIAYTKEIAGENYDNAETLGTIIDLSDEDEEHELGLEYEDGVFRFYVDGSLEEEVDTALEDEEDDEWDDWDEEEDSEDENDF